MAIGWPISRVDTFLRSGERDALVKFIGQRYKERFLNPIKTLSDAPDSTSGYGFAIMALCSLLIESLQSYRYGLPSTDKGEFSRLAAFNAPPEFDVPLQERKSGTEVFEDFFSFPVHQPLFPGVDGRTFYLAIRNGLLHQAQTKDGWRIRTGQSTLWNNADRVIDRNRFAEALAGAFEKYTDELAVAKWDDPVWLRARRKLWWLLRLSR
jgi:hypothetical protein